jgi:hypothetical protein
MNISEHVTLSFSTSANSGTSLIVYSNDVVWRSEVSKHATKTVETVYVRLVVKLVDPKLYVQRLCLNISYGVQN